MCSLSKALSTICRVLCVRSFIQSSEVCMTSEQKIKGPASYFPSIQKTYGKPVTHWLKILDELRDKKHMEQVAHLKLEHGIGHGHANALVAYHRAQPGAY